MDQEKCTQCNVCVSEFGCPAFQREDSGRITVKKDTCIGDGSCVQTCEVRALGRETTGGDK